MSMKMVASTKNDPINIPMNCLVDGQIAELIDSSRTVLCIEKSNCEKIFLILGTHMTTNMYDNNCNLPVRILKPGESVTIKFENQE